MAFRIDAIAAARLRCSPEGRASGNPEGIWRWRTNTRTRHSGSGRVEGLRSGRVRRRASTPRSSISATTPDGASTTWPRPTLTTFAGWRDIPRGSGIERRSSECSDRPCRDRAIGSADHAWRAVSGARTLWTRVVDHHPDLVDVAPHPMFSGLERPDQRMLRRAEMRAGVPMRGRVAAPGVATHQAHPQVHPA